MNLTFYRFIRALVCALMALFHPIRMEGFEHLPGEGPVILCCNHISLRDPILMACAVSRPVCFMAKAELFKWKWFAGALRALGAFPVKRGESDMTSLRTALAILKEGKPLGIFSQGHRDASGEMGMESGVSLLALRSGAPVIPVWISGPYRLFRPIRVIMGPAVEIANGQGKYDGARLREVTVEIESAVRALTPVKNA